MKYLVTRNNHPVNVLRGFDSIFDSFWNDGWGSDVLSASLPAVDIAEKDDAYVLEAELPGMDEKNISVNVENHVLRISSHVVEGKADEQKEENKYLIRERQERFFDRSFTLPENVDEENISAQFRKGILVLTIPKSEVAKPRKIDVKIA
ncbi:Hsp20/alpha crystallin family protein [Parasphaerochaeta coccoides]|uniref:Heat shock protein Hsp20 n=1 Tax=Parasphaerochaeta coccoides (strain ATCC BAA-1237 / DSM 17374 / SPN1) TaxID=760011 RepID=F4GL00_PARC1|nr:Hsp20/alpha crystallin family protein [Parasphaerochaeta coccoides]AEC02340.1 heat shock protein Hsp20 [Parasphaerochaeta coccoides DSM 17374]